MNLLKTCLHSLAVIFEIKLPEEISDSIKLIEEVLIYLSTLINFVPKRCVICIKQMLKYMFYMNYVCRTKQYEYFTENLFEVNDTAKVLNLFVVVKRFSAYKQYMACADDGISSSSDASSINSSSGTNLFQSDKFTNLSNHIKLFEPIVIRCLKVRVLY